jgi:ATP synthase protein I
MTANPPGPSKEDFNARLRTARAKQAKREGGPAPGVSRGSGIGFAFRIGTELVAGVVMGVAIGLALDYWLDSRPWFMIVFFFLGAGAGITNVIRTATGIGHAVGYEKLDEAPKPGAGRDENGK